ncbi:MAG: SCP2 sterol-binding domain-containing protein [Deltaproteobacteria bacterium]|nr:SCP2 sterol-binding domain-containing protein [Nannocystaceae bacterium]
MSLETITTTVKEKVGNDCGLGATLKFHLGSEGVVHIDATQVPNVVSNDDAAAQCTIKMKISDLEDMLVGKLDPMAAFSLGKLQLEGDLGVAMKLGGLMKR